MDKANKTSTDRSFYTPERIAAVDDAVFRYAAEPDSTREDRYLAFQRAATIIKEGGKLRKEWWKAIDIACNREGIDLAKVQAGKA